MKLDVLPTTQTQPWYADGLAFTCSQCGNCCTGPPGYVYISRVGIQRLAEHLKLPVEQGIETYCRPVVSRYSLKEKRCPGGYDCIFLQEGGKQRQCSIYPVSPLQCRTR